MTFTEEDKRYFRLTALAEFQIVVNNALIENEKLPDSDNKEVEKAICFRLLSAIETRNQKVEDDFSSLNLNQTNS